MAVQVPVNVIGLTSNTQLDIVVELPSRISPYEVKPNSDTLTVEVVPELLATVKEAGKAVPDTKHMTPALTLPQLPADMYLEP